jgi:hypothetical protein
MPMSGRSIIVQVAGIETSQGLAAEKALHLPYAVCCRGEAIYAAFHSRASALPHTKNVIYVL